MALSIFPNALCALAALDTLTELRPMDVRSSAFKFKLSVLLAPLLKPTCNEKLRADPLSNAVPLNSVTEAIRSISDRNWVNSWSMYDRSVVPTVPLEDWDANSRNRDKMFPIVCAEPSAICVKLMPSFEFRRAWLMLAMLFCMVSDTPRPAASSAARV